MKNNYIRDIVLKIGIDVSYKDCGAIYRIDKNTESGYCLVKCTSESYIFWSSKKLRNYVIKAGEMLCDGVYFNPLDNIKQWYIPYEY